MCHSAYGPRCPWGYSHIALGDEEGKIHTARRTLYLPVMFAAAAGVACLIALLAVSQKSEAAFPGKNGRIAYQGSDGVIYTINPNGGGNETEITDREYEVFESPSWGAGNGFSCGLYASGLGVGEGWGL